MSRTVWFHRTHHSPTWRVYRHRVDALHQCCFSDYGDKRKMDINPPRRVFPRTDRATKWSYMQVDGMHLRASAGATSAHGTYRFWLRRINFTQARKRIR